jgi:hypothetical protein
MTIVEMVFEESYSDYWLFLGLRSSFAKQYKVRRSGVKIHRVSIEIIRSIN